MNRLSVQTMARLLTRPYRRGTEILEIPLGDDAGGATEIAPYDFTEYRARYQADPPPPRYVLFPRQDTGKDELQINVDFSLGGATQTAALKIPAQTFAGTSFALPLPATADATLRLLSFRQVPMALAGLVGKDNWGLIALLGNIAKLAWVLGWEKDLIRRHLHDIQQQRRRALARGFSLDKLGEDLRVPRFPPREHSFDADTIALYHLNDLPATAQPEVVTVADETQRFGLTGHAGTNKGVQSRATGKFGRGFRFPDAGVIEIPTHADFAIPANGSFTVEVFVKVEASASVSPLRIVMIKGALNAAGELTAAGWYLALEDSRGIANNVKWAISDGTNKIALFADRNISDGQFHHLAGVIDRTSRRSRLWVDGEERANADLGAFGDVTNGQHIRLGRSAAGNQFAGVMDEVRLSKVARSDFHPVLGEGDDAYRERLGIFERWLLPTPAALLETINRLVQINNQKDSFVLIEKNRTLAGAGKLVRLLPATLTAGESIDRDGNLPEKESAVSGAPADEADFREIYLLRHNRPNVDYGVVENNRRLQVATKNALDTLLDLLAAATPPLAGNLFIDKSFDPNDAGLHRVGRALRLRHQNLAPALLAVQAHRAGFDFVQNQGTHVFASVAAGEKLEIVLEPASTALSNRILTAVTAIQVSSATNFPSNPPFRIRVENEVMMVTAMRATTWTVTRGADATIAAAHAAGVAVIHIPPAGIDVLLNKAINLHLAPEALPAGGQIKWTLIPCGAARARFDEYEQTSLRTPVTSRPHLRLFAEAPGEIAVRVEYTSQRRTVTGTRTLQIGIETLSNGQTIAANGDMKIKEDEVVGKPGEAINSIYLITSNAAVNFGANANNRKMQIVLERPFNRLVELLAAGSTGLVVLKAFNPADVGLHKAGRAMRFRHNTINADELGALAHQAGFDFVRRLKFPVLGIDEIYCSVAAGGKIEIARASDLKPLPDELTVGVPVDLRARFTTLPPTGNYNWSLERVGNAQGVFDFILRPQVKFTPHAPGLLLLNVTYLEPDPLSTFPYTFEIKLKGSLDVPGTNIPKHQYDLIMNILNYFHPIGVEVMTRNIREHVVELKENLLDAFPGYTYPDFRR